MRLSGIIRPLGQRSGPLGLLLLAGTLVAVWFWQTQAVPAASGAADAIRVREDIIPGSQSNRHAETIAIKAQQPLGKDPPPEDLATIAVCAEKCKHVKGNCDAAFQAKLGHPPAPKCTWYSETHADDPYWKKEEAVNARNEKTRALVVWGGRQARLQGAHLISCEDRLTPSHTSPMMFPEEFEMVIKTLAQHRPATYLEWGSGKSTSFYPLLASGKVAVIDGYPPWCDIVQSDPVVQCLAESGRLSFACRAPVRDDGVEIQLLGEGRLPSDISDADVSVIMHTYVNAVEDTGFKTFDAALVDGRFRVACALKLLSYLHSSSILFMHDFWLRPRYHVVLAYYDVVGTARSIVVLRKKTVLPADHKTAYLRFMNRESMI